MTLEELKQKLNEEPLAEEISFLPDSEVRYLSIDVVRKKADLLFDSWEHFDFVFTTFIHEKDTWASGSINLNIFFQKERYERELSGAATIRLKDYPNNPHFAGTLKSLCIVNALSNEYPCFGKNLNEGLFSTVPDVEPIGKHYPTPIENQKFKNAVKEKNIQLIQELADQYVLNEHPSYKEAMELLISDVSTVL